MRRLLFIAHRSNMVGGAEDDFEKLLNYFSNRKNKYEVHCLIPHGPREKIYSKYCTKTGYYLEGFFPTLYLNPLYYIKYFLKCIIQTKEFKKFILKEKYDVIIFNVSVLLCPLYFFNKRNMKSLVFIRETIKPDFIRKLVYKFINKRTKRIIAVSETNKNDYKKITKSEDVYRVYSSVEKKEIELSLSEINEAEKYITKKISNKLNSKCFKIISIGPVCELKNQKLAIESIKLIKDNYPTMDICFMNIGNYNINDKYFKKISKYIGDYKLSDCCFFLGELEKKITYEIIKKSNVILITSLSEGFPLVLVESFMFKKPLISTKVGGIMDVVKNNYNGIIIEWSTVSLKNAIIKLKNEKNIANYLSENAYKDFNNLFIFENNIKKIEDIMEEIINECE